jgi:integrase/recombinase XerC
VGTKGYMPGAAGLHLAAGVPLLRAEEQVFAAMVEGWRDQQLARNLALATAEGRVRVVRALAEHAGAFPWDWSPRMVEAWCAHLRTARRVRHSTVRNYQEAVRLFCDFVTDPAYGWQEQCLTRFGTHPVQVIHEWNTAAHTQDVESDPSKRAFTPGELQAFFDYADDQVERARAAGRKGWLPAFRDATLFKVAYGFGLRRREAQMLDVADFGRNPHAAEYGDYGVCYVRWGKANKGSPPKRRSVLVVWPWVVEALGQWVGEVRPLLAAGGNPALWPSERAPRVGLQQLNNRFAAYRSALGLDTGLDFHSLRRSYVTHLVEAGWDALFVQQQVGHAHASTTAIYTCVSADFRTRTLRRVLDEAMGAAAPGG